MPLNFNVSPYYDDFDQTKNFHRILFKPGFAVQARELTQSQTILQDQITKFADNVFKQNSPVTGGEVTTNFNCYYIKLEDTYNSANIDVTQFDGLLLQDATGEILARVLGVAAGASGDPNTLIVSYLTGQRFTDGDVIYDTASNLACQAIAAASTGTSSVASISQGVFYVLGNFVQIQNDTIVLNKYDSTPSMRVGLTITETIYDYVDDPSLLDPAVGASNYQAPGADRYIISLSLDTRPLQFGDDDNFIELVRITDGSVEKMVDGSVYNVIDDYFAKRTYDTNGDYIVNDFRLTPKTTDLTTDPTGDTYTMSVGKGIAYVHGYRLENHAPVDLISNRARTTSSQNNTPVFIDYGSYFYVDHVKGTTTRATGVSNTFFDVTTTQEIDLHCVDLPNVSTTNATTYASTLVGTGYIRGLTFDYSTSDTDTSTYVYKAFVNDIDSNTLTGTARAATTTTIQLATTASAVNNAYVGVQIYITGGTDAGDFRTISSYDGSTKTATVSSAWTITPDTSSTYSLNFAIKDVETVVYANKTSYPAIIESSAAINSLGKTGGLSTGDTILENPTIPEMIFRVGNPYVASLSDTSYETQQVWRDIQFLSSGGSVTADLSLESGGLINAIQHFGTPSSTLSSDVVKQNYTIVVTNKGTNSTINVGDVLSWTNTAIRTITLDGDSSIATLSSTDLSPFTANIVEKVQVINGDSSGSAFITKLKNLIQANTTGINISGTTVNTYTHVDDTTLTSSGQIYIENAGLVTPGQAQSLYLSDVKRIVKIIDTKASGTTPTVSMLTNPAYDVTNNYIFDNGQRDSFYDHATITLKSGASQPLGNLLVLVDYYQHAAGDGFFSLLSYTSSSLTEQYQEIPNYVSRHGTVYQLRDCLDFRPARKNAQSSFIFRYGNSSDSQRYGAYLPTDLSTFLGDYSFYLGRKDKLVLSKDRSLQIIEGAPSINPLFPTEPDGSLVIAQLTHNPYTGYIPTEAPPGFLPDLSVERVKHKRYTMQDIAGLENRINNVEYYTSLNMLEQKAQSLQISDAYGLNRFKNGILVDDFSSFGTADTYNPDYSATINRRDRIMTATQKVQNFPLKSLDQVYSLGQLSSSVANSLSYSITADGYVHYYSLPYTTANVASQKLASRTVNVNPFSYCLMDGTIGLSPNVDNWVDTNYAPALLITDPNMQVFQSNSAAINVLTSGDWQAISGTSTTVSSGPVEGHNINWSPFGYIGYIKNTTTTVTNLAQNQILGPYDNIGNTYSLNNGYITDVSVLPYIRSQQIVVRAKGMLFNSNIGAYFDKTNVNNYVRKGNVIELKNVTGSFKEDDVVGYYTGAKFYPTGRVLGVYNYPGTANTRLYVAADQTSNTYSMNGTIQNAQFNTTGGYSSTTANGRIHVSSHFAGPVANANTTLQKFSLSKLASTTNDWYTGNTIYINAGSGQGQSATITNYYGSNTTVVLDSALTFANGDIYSIGTFKTDQAGAFYGVLNLPENTFHTGERIFRLDNRVNGNAGTETTYAEGTFYAQGLQTTAQQVDFGASPAGAKGTFTRTNYANTVNISVSYSPWDPVAQTFMVSKDNYPNGFFMDNVKLFFRTKPTADNSPITLSIVGTLNGYPNGSTLDHSIVTLTPDQVNTSDSPQYLDSTVATTFKFSSPVYIQPGVLYAIIVKSNSNQYTMWTASNGDTALASSVKNLPTDPVPSTITKIGSAPYVGALFISQNAQTWTPDQNQSLMFVMDRCKFSKTPASVTYVVPNKLPQRTLVDQSVQYFLNANNVSSSIDSVTSTDVLVDAFNITTTDFVPTTTSVNYSYNATLHNTGTAAGIQNIVPGKYGTTTSDNIYLNDGKGERVLVANSNSSFTLYTQLSTSDDAVSPIISDAGLTVYAVEWNVNNCELSNNNVVITSGGTGYSSGTVGVTVSAPTGSSGEQAYASANVVSGVIDKIYFTTPGSGYIETPTLTITGANTTHATAIVMGETSSSGGTGLAKYVTKKVVLDAGFDSGDLNVYITAYRPVNTDINVYYKILNRNDTQKFEDGNWQLMTKTNSGGSLYSQTRKDLYEYTFAPGTEGVDQGYVSYTSTNGQTYTTFSQFAIKIVLTTTDNTAVPFLTDLRALALPPNV